MGEALQGAGVVANDRQIRAFGDCEALDETGEPCLWVTLEDIGTLNWRTK